MIFVTGGTGLLGNCVVRELLSRNLPVRALCREATDQRPFEELDVELVTGDLSSEAVLRRAMQGCSAVIHSAAMIHIGWQRLEESNRVNVEGTRRIAELAIESKIRMIHVSTVDTLPAAVSKNAPVDESCTGGVEKTQCSYVVSKTESEQVVKALTRDSALDSVIVNPGFMLAPYDWKPSSGRMYLQVHQAPIAAAPPGGCSFCDARDVAKAIVNCLNEVESGSQFILGGHNLTYQELWTHMLREAGSKKRVFQLGKSIRLVGKLLDAAFRWLPLREGDVNGAAIEMGSLNHYYDSSRAQQALAYSNRPMEETLRDAWVFLNRS